MTSVGVKISQSTVNRVITVFILLPLACYHTQVQLHQNGLKKKPQKPLKQDRLEFEQFSFLARLYLSISIRLLLRLIAPPSLPPLAAHTAVSGAN